MRTVSRLMTHFTSANSIAEPYVANRQQKERHRDHQETRISHTAPRLNSEFVDQVHAEKQLISGFSVVVCLQVPRMIESDFRTEHNRAADVSGGVKRILRILRGEPGTLPLLVVEKIGAKPEHQLGADVTIYVVNDRVFGSGAAQLSGGAECAI